MCNFVPGECLAFGRVGMLREASLRDVLGRAVVVPLRYDAAEADDTFSDFGFLHVTGIPLGLECHVVSHLSAALAKSIETGEAHVELNYYLPAASPRFASRPKGLRLTDMAAHWAHRIARSFDDSEPNQSPVALIDSGLNPASIPGRSVVALDFSNGATGSVRRDAHDGNGHGTRVARVLHECLPSAIPIISVKIADTDYQVTVLTLSRCFAEVVARHRPAVVNLSLAPLDDSFACPGCGEKVCVPAFHSSILRRVIGLASRSFVVMAAGNDGQACNDRHLDDLVHNLVFAVAIDSNLKRAAYSGAPTGAGGAETAALAFGGDGTKAPQSGVFVDDPDSFGTSYAAPFISASVYPAVARLNALNRNVHRQSVLPAAHYKRATGWYPAWV